MVDSIAKEILIKGKRREKDKKYRERRNPFKYLHHDLDSPPLAVSVRQ
jgi:hypothetical protein